MSKLSADEIYNQIIVPYIRSNNSITEKTSQKELWNIKHFIKTKNQAPSLGSLVSKLNLGSGKLQIYSDKSTLHFFSGGQGRDRVYKLLK